MAKHIFRYLDTNGDGSGTKNANGDYSSVADEFYCQPDMSVYINRLIISIEDTSGMQAQEYGNLGSELTNGWELKVTDASGSVKLDLTDGIAVKTNAQIGRNCYDVDVKTWGAGDELLVARWTFGASGAPLYLSANDKLSVTFNDDLSGLISHYFLIQGIND